jgi:hypothetical protein
MMNEKSDSTKTIKPPHYDAKGRFINGDCCICGKSAGFGVGVFLLRNQLGVWYCFEHWREWKATHESAG